MEINWDYVFNEVLPTGVVFVVLCIVVACMLLVARLAMKAWKQFTQDVLGDKDDL